MVMADGFAWNGQTYDSLSKVALRHHRPPSGTGPRFLWPPGQGGSIDDGGSRALAHTARHEAAELRFLPSTRSGQTICASGAVRFGDQGRRRERRSSYSQGGLDSGPVLRFPINIADSKAVLRRNSTIPCRWRDDRTNC